MPDKPELASALYKAAAPGKRVGIRVVAFLVVSVAAAGGSALLLTRYMEARTRQARVPTEKVVVADVELPVGTELRPENLKAIDWPAASVPEGAFRDPKELEGKVVASRVHRFEPLLPSKLTGSGTGGLSALLPAGMRAAAVKVDDVVGVAGFVQPGDSVDVIATIRSDGGSSVTSSRVILQNVRVLAVGKELDVKSKSDKVVPATVATLMVDAEGSERLALAAAQGKLLLTLRGAADSEIVETRGVTATALLSQPSQPPADATKPQRRLVRAPPPAAPAKPPDRVVEILRGDLYEKRKFEGAGQ